MRGPTSSRFKEQMRKMDIVAKAWNENSCRIYLKNKMQTSNGRELDALNVN